MSRRQKAPATSTRRKKPRRAALRSADGAKQACGWGSPPYHPLCRGQLVPLGTVEGMVPVQELVVEQEFVPPPQI
jgi:hypothetical protein